MIRSRRITPRQAFTRPAATSAGTSTGASQTAGPPPARVTTSAATTASNPPSATGTIACRSINPVIRYGDQEDRRRSSVSTRAGSSNCATARYPKSSAAPEATQDGSPRVLCAGTAQSSAGAVSSTARPSRDGARSSAVASRHGTISHFCRGTGSRSRCHGRDPPAPLTASRAARSSTLRSAASTPAAVRARSRSRCSGMAAAVRSASTSAAPVPPTSSAAATQAPGTDAWVGPSAAIPAHPHGPDHNSPRSSHPTRCPATANPHCTASPSTASTAAGVSRRTQRAARSLRSTQTAALVASSGTPSPPTRHQPNAAASPTRSINPSATIAPQVATSPGKAASAQDSQNQGRSTGRGRTGCASSQSIAARGGTTGPRHIASRSMTRNVPSATAVTPVGSAASSWPPCPV